MSDFNSSLPVRTQANGDVVAFIADGTTSTQLLSIDASGRLTIKLDDGSGNPIDSQALSASQWLQVVAPSIGPASPGTAALFSDLVAGIYNAAAPTLTDGQQASLQLTSSGELKVSASFSFDTDYGVVGVNTLRTAAQIGNATGAADFDAGVTGAQTLRVVANQGAASSAAAGWFVRPTDGTNSQAYTVAGEAKVDLTSSFEDQNYGVVGATTLRTAAQIGSATGAADFDAGATSAQTLRVAANLYDATGAAISASNPLPVIIESSPPGSHVNDFKQASAIAAGSSDSHDYTVTAGKTFHFTQVEASASGKAKVQVQVETGVATGVFTSYFVQFNSTATPNMTLVLSESIEVAAGVRVRVIVTNRDVQADDLYSTICGFEV